LAKKSITIAGVTAAPGEKKTGVVEVHDLFADEQPLEIPFIIYNGAKEGPWLHIQVAQHPTEVYSLEGVRRVLGALNPKDLSGTVTFSLPNPIGFRFASYYGRILTHDINRVLSGKPDGSVMERIVHAWWINFVEGKADYVVDLHGTPPATFVYYEAEGVSPDVPREVAEKSERMALLFSCEMVKKEMEEYGGGTSFRGACVDAGIPAIVPEVAPDGADISEVGLRNIMVDLGMIKGKIKLPPKQYILNWETDPTNSSVKNKKGGVFTANVKIGDVVEKGDKVGFIYSPRTLQVTEEIFASRGGYVSSINSYPVKSAGETLLSIDEILQVVSNK
jgi:hypothetical protein